MALSLMMQMFPTYAIQYGSYSSVLAFEHLKCDWGTDFLNLFNFD